MENNFSSINLMPQGHMQIKRFKLFLLELRVPYIIILLLRLELCRMVTSSSMENLRVTLDPKVVLALILIE
jgi:hypothetical protein